jgi:hypothetical protein
LFGNSISLSSPYKFTYVLHRVFPSYRARERMRKRVEPFISSTNGGCSSFCCTLNKRFGMLKMRTLHLLDTVITPPPTLAKVSSPHLGEAYVPYFYAGWFLLLVGYAGHVAWRALLTFWSVYWVAYNLPAAWIAVCRRMVADYSQRGRSPSIFFSFGCILGRSLSGARVRGRESTNRLVA